MAFHRRFWIDQASGYQAAGSVQYAHPNTYNRARSYGTANANIKIEEDDADYVDDYDNEIPQYSLRSAMVQRETRFTYGEVGQSINYDKIDHKPAENFYYPTATQQNGFRSTVIIELSSACLKVSGTLFDSGADYTTIHRRVVEEAGLAISRVSPISLQYADGRHFTYSEVVHIKLWISGVSNMLTAYVKDHERSDLLLLGADMIHLFRCKMNGGHLKRGWRVMVSNNKDGLRRMQFVVEPDDSSGRGGGGRSTVTRMGKREGVQWSQDRGKTPAEYDEHLRRERYAQKAVWF